VSIETKRVYADRTGDRALLVGGETGIVCASVTGDRVGTFGVERTGPARDLAAGDGRVLVAAADGVLERDADGTYDRSAAVDATAVGTADGTVYAADADGRLWLCGHDRCRVEGVGRVRAIDRNLAATRDTAVRVGPDGEGVALTPDAPGTVRDVAATAAGPVVATAAGIVDRDGRAWRNVVPGSASLVFGRDRPVGVVDGDVVEWEASGEVARRRDAPPEVVAGTRTDEAILIVTADGTLHATDREGWRSWPLGIDAPTAALAP
jgi:hypothetical protein